MRRKGQVLVSLILYILILAGALHFNLWKLIDIRLLLLMVLGTVVLTLPFYIWEKGNRSRIYTNVFAAVCGAAKLRGQKHVFA